MVAGMKPYCEQIARFGSRHHLSGIIAEPRGGRHDDKPAIVILNSGIIHRIGHHRMYVTMARLLAAAGYPVLRFDLSGIGDSANRSDSLAPEAAAMADIETALNWLSDTRDIKTAVLLGLCSGAEAALRYGYTDARISSLVLLDPTTPPTWKFYAHYLGQRVTSLRSWRTFLRGRGRIWGDLIIRLLAAVGFPMIEARGRLVDPQSRSELEALYERSIEQNINFLIVFTGGMAAYKEQLFDAFPSLRSSDQLTLEFLDGCDHIFTPPEHREKLNHLVLTFLRKISCERTTVSASAAQ